MTWHDKKRRLWDLFFNDVERFHLFADQVPPANAATDDGSLVVGVEFAVTEFGCRLSEIGFWQPAGNDPSAATREVALYNSTTGVLLSAVEALPVSGNGKWNFKKLAAPIPLAVGTRYLAAVHHPAGRYASQQNFFGDVDTPVEGTPLVYGGRFTSVGFAQGSYEYSPTMVPPRDTANQSNYWVDVTVEQEK